MRLAIAVEHYRAGVGGAESMALDVVSGLRQRSHQVLVCAETGGDDRDFVKVFPSEAAAAARAWGAECLMDWGIRIPADVHYLHGGPHDIFLRYSVLASRRLVRWWKHLEILLKSKHRRTISNQRRLFSKPNTAFLAVSEFVARQVGNRIPPSSSIHVLHNPVDIRRFAPERVGPHRRRVRRELGLSEGDVVFLWVAHNPRLKNLRLLTDLFPGIHRADPRAKLLAVGRHTPRIQAPWFRRAGTLDRIEEGYGAGDVLLHPTYYDTFGNVVTEALACELPVVCSDRAGAAEVMAGRDCGLVIPVGEGGAREAWRRAIVGLLEDEDRRKVLGRNGRSVAAELDFSRYIERLEQFLMTVPHRGSGAAR